MPELFKLTNTGTQGIALRSGANVTFPRLQMTQPPNIPADLVTAVGYITPNTSVIGSEIITLQEDVKNAEGAIVGKVGDQWLHVIEILDEFNNTYLVEGFTAITHMGILQKVKVEDYTDPVPGPTPNPTVNPIHAIINNGNNDHHIGVSVMVGSDGVLYIDVQESKNLPVKVKVNDVER